MSIGESLSFDNWVAREPSGDGARLTVESQPYSAELPCSLQVHITALYEHVRTMYVKSAHKMIMHFS